MMERQGIEIDYCPKCRGVWLGRGKLDKLIERSAVYEAGAVASAEPLYGPAPLVQPGHGGPWDGGHGGGHGRRQGFLGGLFD